MKQERYSDQLNRFQEIDAMQFNFCRYEGAYPATKTEIYRGCLQQNFAKF